jgi:hypothetical protein
MELGSRQGGMVLGSRGAAGVPGYDYTEGERMSGTGWGITLVSYN